MPINLLFLYKKELSGAVFINKIEREREARVKYKSRGERNFFFFLGE